MQPKNLIPTLILCAAPAAADTFSVHPTPGSGDFTTVTDALASPLVGDGDIVRVHPGTYTGTYVLTKTILLESVDGPDLTVLDGGGAGTVLTIEVGATVQGFEITGGGGPASQGGVFVTSLELATVRDCHIVENHADGDVGLPCGGIGVDFYAAALIVGNVIESNTGISVGGVMTGAFAEVDMIGNWIRGNGGAGTATGGVLWGASGRVVNNQITGNYATGIGGFYLVGGLGDAPEGALVDIVSCTIYGNRGTFPGGSAGGVVLGDGGKVTIVNTIIYDNFGSPIMDLGDVTDFFSKGTLDLSFSHVKLPSSGIPMGSDMVFPPELDPAFVLPIIAPPDGPITIGDYHLTAASADLDLGDDGAFPLDTAAGDLGGVLRSLGSAIDIGAYEFGTSCPAPIYYGFGKVSSAGVRPDLISVGEPSVSGSGFHLELREASPLAFSLLLDGGAPDYKPFRGGILWVEYVASVTPRTLFKTDSSGTAVIDLGLDSSMIGSTHYYQSWFRDTAHSDGTSAGFSSAVAVTFCS